jgi:uncharacterized protein (TIGR02246 family)
LSLHNLEPSAFVAVQRLLARYATQLDEGDAEAVAELFTPGGRMEQTPGDLMLSGRTEIRVFLAERERSRDPSLPRRRHHVSTIDARVDDDGIVYATSYFHVVGPGDQVAGVYEDEISADGDRWLFARRIVRVEVRGE